MVCLHVHPYVAFLSKHSMQHMQGPRAYWRFPHQPERQVDTEDSEVVEFMALWQTQAVGTLNIHTC